MKILSLIIILLFNNTISFSNENNNTATENIILQEPEPLTITLDNDVDLCGNPDSENNIQVMKIKQMKF